MSARGGRAIHDVLVALVRGEAPDGAVLEVARGSSLESWTRVVRLEGCGAQLHELLRRRALASAGESPAEMIPPPFDTVLRERAQAALGGSVRLHAQLVGVAQTASNAGVQVMALKGAARMLADAGTACRGVNDIDLLVLDGDARALHRALCTQLGYAVRTDGASAHHLPALALAGSLDVELHTTSAAGAPGVALDALLRNGARECCVGAHAVWVPSPTALLLHTLHHAVAAHWGQRYRLRDLFDIAALWSADVDRDAVLGFVASSPHRRAMEIAISAARSLEPTLPQLHRDPWRVVRRVGRARSAAVARARTIDHTVRMPRLAGAFAELSARALAHAASSSLRRQSRRLLGAVGMLAQFTTVGCSGGGTGPVEPPPAPTPFPAVAPFVFASEATGESRLYQWSAGTTALITRSVAGDTDPHSAAGRMVYTTFRHGHADVYIANIDGSDSLRLTTNGAYDGEAQLSPDGSRVAFASNRGGVYRVWTVNADGTGVDSLVTGRTGATPERAPAWSPEGERIAFTSARSGLSQVWVVPAGGGAATPVTSEVGGAFSPAWSADGQYIIYVEASGTPRLRRVRVSSGAQEAFASVSAALGGASCNGTVCLSARGAVGGNSAVVAVRASGGADTVLVSGGHGFARPAFVVP